MFYFVYRTPHHIRAVKSAKPINTKREAEMLMGGRLIWYAPVNFWYYLKYKIFNYRIDY